MRAEVLSSSNRNQQVNIDPRTKLVVLITICILVIGGEIGGIMLLIKPLLTGITLILLLLSGKRYLALICALIYFGAFAAEFFLLPLVPGLPGFILLFFCGFLSRLLPGMMMGYYTLGSTTVSEFIAAMDRIHLSEKLIIPLAVMFRFFPTVMEEYRAIGDAMRMRGIHPGGTKASKMLEYRLIPMLICSVKIGEELSAAALTRGLGAPVRRTNICRIGFHSADIILIGLCLVMFILTWIW